jgi:hypothetical protein
MVDKPVIDKARSIFEGVGKNLMPQRDRGHCRPIDPDRHDNPERLVIAPPKRRALRLWLIIRRPSRPIAAAIFSPYSTR